VIGDDEVEPIGGLPGNRGPGDPQVGEIWAWEARDSIVAATVLNWGVRRVGAHVAYVRVQPMDGDSPQRWVQPSRLVARWSDLDAYLELKARWARVMATNPPKDTPDEHAAWCVFDVTIPYDVARIEGGSRGPVLNIGDSEHLSELTGLHESVWHRTEGFRLPAGSFVAPWPVTLAVAEQAARRNPLPLLRIVETDEDEARHKAVHGVWCISETAPRTWEEIGELRQTPQEAAREDSTSSYGRPMRDILRSWCAGEPAEWEPPATGGSDPLAIRSVGCQAVAELRSKGLTDTAELVDAVLSALFAGGRSGARTSARR
jgi:hypothetical protein